MENMTVRVFQFWNGRDVSIREVEVPGEEIDKIDWLTNADDAAASVDNAKSQLLSLVFKYGQNDVQPREAPSVSVGDIIELKMSPDDLASHYAVASFGFADYNRDKHFVFRGSKPLDKNVREAVLLDEKGDVVFRGHPADMPVRFVDKAGEIVNWTMNEAVEGGTPMDSESSTDLEIHDAG